MRCNVCNKDKEQDQFQTYWHSTQNIKRTRKQCTECFYKNRMKKRNPDNYYQNNPDYKKCISCSQWKDINTAFYIRKARDGRKLYSNSCKVCKKTIQKETREEEKSFNCGSAMVPQKPNKYFDKYQKQCTFNMMELLGYTFDKPTGIWIKPGHKEIKDGKPFFPNLKKQISKKVTLDMVNEMIELRKLGWGYQRIGYHLNISDTSVFKYIKKNEQIN